MCLVCVVDVSAHPDPRVGQDWRGARLVEDGAGQLHQGVCVCVCVCVGGGGAGGVHVGDVFGCRLGEGARDGRDREGSMLWATRRWGKRGRYA